MKKLFTLNAFIITLLFLFHYSSSAQIVEPDMQDSVKKMKAIKANSLKADSSKADSSKADSLKADTAKVNSSVSYQSGGKAQSIYFEVGGPGLALTLNYDARFGDQRNGLGYRIGGGYFASGGNTVFTLPIQVNYLIGEGNALIELGAGTTFLNSTGDNKGKTFIFDRVTGFIGTATIGFRYQPDGKGINFRIGFVPILYDEGIIAAGGVSVGYNFR